MSTEYIVKTSGLFTDNAVQLVVVEQSSMFRLFLRKNSEAPADVVLGSISPQELRSIAKRLDEIADYFIDDESDDEAGW